MTNNTGIASIKVSLDTSKINKSMQTLHGMLMGIVSDGHLHDMEVALLSTWLSEHPDVATTWPGSSVAEAIRSALLDGVITNDERQHLLDVLSDFSPNNFRETGTAAPEPTRIPIDTTASIELNGANVCHTGVFLYGTRAKCEKLTERAGGFPVASVTKGTNLLIVGGRVSPSWVQESYGRKILKAVDLKNEGVALFIISEEQWIAAINAMCSDEDNS